MLFSWLNMLLVIILGKTMMFLFLFNSTFHFDCTKHLQEYNKELKIKNRKINITVHWVRFAQGMFVALRADERSTRVGGVRLRALLVSSTAGSMLLLPGSHFISRSGTVQRSTIGFHAEGRRRLSSRLLKLCGLFSISIASRIILCL